MRNKPLFIILSFACVLFPVNIVLSHNTTLIHPRISEYARSFLSDSDQIEAKYTELYRQDGNVYTFWGDDLNYTRDEDYTGYADSRNVIGGVVMEDSPASRVLDHFYHSVTGIPLTIPIICITLTFKITGLESGQKSNRLNFSHNK